MKLNAPAGLAPAALAPADAGTGTHKTAPVAEIVTFRLREGISDDAFLGAAEAINPLLLNTGEVISRSLSRDDDGLWCDYIVWASMKSAREAAALVMQQPEFAPMGAMIDGDSVALRYASILMQMD